MDDQGNPSRWMRTSAEVTFLALRRDLRVDVAVVGGGITGLPPLCC